MRIVIDVPDDIIESLDRVSGHKKRSRAALIREAITEYLRKDPPPKASSAFGIWKGKPKDGVGYQNELRSDWERE